MKRKTALFGGTFDPVHRGHVIVAESATKYIGADEVVFIPAQRSPNKNLCAVADGDARLKMISLAIEGRKGFRVSDCELNRPGPSFTLDTVKQFSETCGKEAAIYWLVGADSVDDLLNWHRIDELIDRCNLCVMFRGGFAEPDFAGFDAVLAPARAAKLRRNVIPTPLVDISSTEIRRRLSVGEDVADMVAPAVLDYIRQHNLYGPGRCA